MERAAFHPVKAGAAYFALVFALGFVLGTIRVLWLAPMVGETNAVLAELPVMLAASWFAARWLLGGSHASLSERAMMGALAFALLMGAELALGVLAFGESPRERLTGLTHMPGPIGLAGQIAFGLMPVLIRPARRS